MPGAPAPRQTLTASMTDGTDPPRELRTVAILLTLTESFGKKKSQIANPKSRIPSSNPNHTTLGLGAWDLGFAILHSRGEVLLHGVSDFLGPRRDLALVLTFDHD